MMWCLGASPDAKREFHRLFIENAWDAKNGIITARKHLWETPNAGGGHWNTEWPYTAFHALWLPDSPGSADLRAVGDHGIFTGRHGDQRRPAWLAGSRWKDAEGFGRHGDAVAAIATFLELGPGDETDVMLALGATETSCEPSTILRPYRGADAMDTVLKRVEATWSSRLDRVRVETPDPAFNLLNNVWLPYQAMSARLWGRTGYWQQSGAFGFRDQLQDSQVYLPQHPDQCLAQICLHARHQFSDGSVYHWWHPLAETGLETKKTDNLLWLPFVLENYIRETGVLDVLDLRAPFVDATTTATLWDHCQRAIGHALSRFSPRGLPLIGEGDWNDGMSACGRQGTGESVWLGHFLYLILKEWSELARRRGEDALAEEWENRARCLCDAVNVIGWDGEWYLRATLDDGTPLGSRFSREGRIFLNPQTWAVIAGTADSDRANRVMDAVETHRLRDYGPILFTPAFSRPDARVGYLTRYAPGRRENGGVYMHAAVWAIQAACLLGRAETAWKVFSRLAPPNRSLDPDLYAVEPYVTPGNVDGPESPQFGQGGWTWYTGSAAWLRRVCLEYILGVRAVFDGLTVSPCMPAEWKHARILRPFRGNLFEIEIHNDDPAGRTSWAMEVNGRPHDPHAPIVGGGGRQNGTIRVKLS
jgi:cellobiose phosphorylase